MTKISGASRIGVALTFVVLWGTGCGGESADTTPEATRLAVAHRQTAGGSKAQRFARDPIVVEERVRGRNQFAIYLRTTRPLRFKSCHGECFEGPFIDARLFLSTGRSRGEAGDILRLGSRRRLYCYLLSGAAFDAGSSLATARPGDEVVVTLAIRKGPRLDRRVTIIAPVPHNDPGTSSDAPYTRALGCGAPGDD